MTINQQLINTVIAAAGNAIPFATAEGNRLYNLSVGQLPAHHHALGFSLAPDGAVGGAVDSIGPSGAVTGDTGSGEPILNMQPTIYLFLFVKL